MAFPSSLGSHLNGLPRVKRKDKELEPEDRAQSIGFLTFFLLVESNAPRPLH